MARGLQRPRKAPSLPTFKQAAPRSGISTNGQTGRSFTQAQKNGRTYNIYEDGRVVGLQPRNQATQSAAAQAAAKAEAQAATQASANAAAKPAAPAAQPAVAVAPAPVVVAAPVAAPAPPIEDDRYTLDVGGLIRDVGSQRAQLAAAGQRDKSDLDRMISELVMQRGDTLNDTDRASNQQGLLYSNVLSRRRGDVENAFGARETEAKTGYDRRESDRVNQLADIGDIIQDASSPTGYRTTGGAGSRLAEIILAARDRANARAAEAAPPAEEPAADAAPAAEAAAPAPAAAKAPLTPAQKKAGQTKKRDDDKAKAQAAAAAARSRSKAKKRKR